MQLNFFLTVNLRKIASPLRVAVQVKGLTDQHYNPVSISATGFLGLTWRRIKKKALPLGSAFFVYKPAGTTIPFSVPIKNV
jgi:hypothetical protein